MGSPWKMPTKDQSNELINGTNHAWTTINNMVGCKLTSKTDSSKYIFLPAGGEYEDTTLYYPNSIGFYWTSTLYSTSMYYCIYFNSSNQFIATSIGWRGIPVRAIK